MHSRVGRVGVDSIHVILRGAFKDQGCHKTFEKKIVQKDVCLYVTKLGAYDDRLR